MHAWCHAGRSPGRGGTCHPPSRPLRPRRDMLRRLSRVCLLCRVPSGASATSSDSEDPLPVPTNAAGFRRTWRRQCKTPQARCVKHTHGCLQLAVATSIQDNISMSSQVQPAWLLMTTQIFDSAALRPVQRPSGQLQSAVHGTQEAQLALGCQQRPEDCFLLQLLPVAAHLIDSSTSKSAVPCRFSFLLACGPEVLQQMVQSEVPGDILADLLKAIHACWRPPGTSAASSPEALSSHLQSLSLQDGGQVTDARAAVEGSATAQSRDGECAGLATCVAGASQGQACRRRCPCSWCRGCSRRPSGGGC